jgi:sterol desaturase/sphingolipid hydroxylase (fatty acid hydroxylase superfamily)
LHQELLTMSEQTQALEQDTLANVDPTDLSTQQTRSQAFLWSLPQPILVIGSMIAVATAFLYEWTDPELFALIMIVLPLPLVLVAERVWTKRRDWLLTPKEFAEDAFWVACGALVWIPIYSGYFSTPISEGFKAVRNMTPLNFKLAPESTLGLILAAIAVKLGVEFIYYWLHRVQHESLFWWRIHATHHHITKMGAGRSDRTHPFEWATLFLGTPIVLALTGASDGVIAVSGAFGFFNGSLNHANLPLRSGWYGWFFATAEQHHLHHSQDMDSSNSNYGCSIIFWDRLFGTYSGRTDIETIGAGTGKPLDILTQFKIPFVSTEKLTRY